MNELGTGQLCSFIFISLEKSLAFSEKWRLHLTSGTYLENIKLKYEAGQLDIENAISEIKNITENYATELPITLRNNNIV